MRLTLPGRAKRAATAAVTSIAAITAAALATGAAPASAAAAASASTGVRAIAYHGYDLSVPANWPVINLATHPDTCVRFDVHAVYLGHPTDQASCPSNLVGRTESILVEPLDTTGQRLVDRFTRIAPAGSGTAAAGAPAGAPAGQLRVAVPSAGVLVTASYGTGKASVERILATGRIGSGAKAVKLAATPQATAPQSTAPQSTTPKSAAAQSAAAPLATAATTTTVAAQPGSYTGEGFDPCAAPSTSQMSAWLASPYRAIGVYIAGDSEACAQPNLTASWISTETAAGWHIIPISVDDQAPCSTFTNRVSSTLSTASSQGTATADSAVANATALGLPTGSVLYDDMEAYDTTNSSCNAAVMTFLSAWTVELHAKGYLSGVYSSAGSGIEALGAQYTTGTYTLPDQIWFAWWNGDADTDAGTYLPAADWSDHQRLHQYSGDTDETWGGVTINVDDDYLDVGAGSVPTCTASPDFTSYSALNTSSTGAQVSAAQCLLTQQGYFTGSANGTYGSDTAAAVSAFQTAKGLSATGSVDSHTWTALLSAGTQPSLEDGSTGTDVERLQRALTAALGQTISIDGDFGPATTSAVETYQGNAGLSVDGEVGPLTWTALQSGK